MTLALYRWRFPLRAAEALLRATAAERRIGFRQAPVQDFLRQK
jgi:hypothetical protein